MARSCAWESDLQKRASGQHKMQWCDQEDEEAGDGRPQWEDVRSSSAAAAEPLTSFLFLLLLLLLPPRVWPMLLIVDSPEDKTSFGMWKSFASRAPMQFAKDVTSQQDGPARERDAGNAAP